MKKRQIIIIAVALVIVVGSSMFSGWLSEQQEPPEKQEVQIPKKYVKTTKVAYVPIETELEVYGRVRTSQNLDVIPEVAGRINRGDVPLKEGQRFRKGDLLLKIDDTEARLRLQSQVSNYMRDLAAIAPDIKIDFPERYESWYGYFKSIELDKPLPELPEYISDKEKTFLATKNIFSTYYTIKSQEENLRKHNIYAPFNGSITEVTFQVGSYVNPGGKIAKILRTDELELKVDVPTSEVRWLQEGGPVEISTQDGSTKYVGRVSRIGDYVDARTQSVNVFIAIAPDRERLYDGLYMKANIPGKVVENGMEIPRGAVFKNNHVYIVQDTLLKDMTVEIHKINPETVVISGLKPGDDLVVEPLINAYNNMVVYKYDAEAEDETDLNLERKELEVEDELADN